MTAEGLRRLLGACVLAFVASGVADAATPDASGVPTVEYKIVTASERGT
jgi:hypothetical protein